MSSPETQDSPVSEVEEVPDGAIFLPDVPSTLSGIRQRNFELLLDRKDCRGLSIADKLFLQDELEEVHSRLLGGNALRSS